MAKYFFKFIFFIAACLSATVSAHALTILGQGKLDVATGGIFATNQWNTGNFSIEYKVTEDAGVVTYDYVLYVPLKNLSHWLLQVSSNFTEVNLFSASGDTGIDPTGNPKTFSSSGPGASNPGIPANLYGYKWNDTTGTGYLSFQMQSNRLPMWGSFYAKDGNSGGPGGGTPVYAYNTGLGNPNGSFILVPDTKEVPEPVSMALLGAGLLGTAALKRRRQVA